MLDAIIETLDVAEKRDAFHRRADERRARVLATGETLSLEQVAEWVEAHLAGENRPLPEPQNTRQRPAE